MMFLSPLDAAWSLLKRDLSEIQEEQEGLRGSAPLSMADLNWWNLPDDIGYPWLEGHVWRDPEDKEGWLRKPVPGWNPLTESEQDWSWIRDPDHPNNEDSAWREIMEILEAARPPEEEPRPMGIRPPTGSFPLSPMHLAWLSMAPLGDERVEESRERIRDFVPDYPEGATHEVHPVDFPIESLDTQLGPAYFESMRPLTRFEAVHPMVEELERMGYSGIGRRNFRRDMEGME